MKNKISLPITYQQKAHLIKNRDLISIFNNDKKLSLYLYKSLNSYDIIRFFKDCDKRLIKKNFLNSETVIQYLREDFTHKEKMFIIQKFHYANYFKILRDKKFKNEFLKNIEGTDIPYLEYLSKDEIFYLCDNKKFTNDMMVYVDNYELMEKVFNSYSYRSFDVNKKFQLQLLENNKPINKIIQISSKPCKEILEKFLSSLLLLNDTDKFKEIFTESIYILKRNSEILDEINNDELFLKLSNFFKDGDFYRNFFLSFIKNEKNIKELSDNTKAKIVTSFYDRKNIKRFINNKNIKKLIIINENLIIEGINDDLNLEEIIFCVYKSEFNNTTNTLLKLTSKYSKKEILKEILKYENFFKNHVPIFLCLFPDISENELNELIIKNKDKDIINCFADPYESSMLLSKFYHVSMDLNNKNFLNSCNINLIQRIKSFEPKLIKNKTFKKSERYNRLEKYSLSYRFDLRKDKNRLTNYEKYQYKSCIPDNEIENFVNTGDIFLVMKFLNKLNNEQLIQALNLFSYSSKEIIMRFLDERRIKEILKISLENSFRTIITSIPEKYITPEICIRYFKQNSFLLKDDLINSPEILNYIVEKQPIILKRIEIKDLNVTKIIIDKCGIEYFLDHFIIYDKELLLYILDFFTAKNSPNIINQIISLELFSFIKEQSDDYKRKILTYCKENDTKAEILNTIKNKTKNEIISSIIFGNRNSFIKIIYNLNDYEFKQASYCRGITCFEESQSYDFVMKSIDKYGKYMDKLPYPFILSMDELIKLIDNKKIDFKLLTSSNDSLENFIFNFSNSDIEKFLDYSINNYDFSYLNSVIPFFLNRIKIKDKELMLKLVKLDSYYSEMSFAFQDPPVEILEYSRCWNKDIKMTNESLEHCSDKLLKRIFETEKTMDVKLFPEEFRKNKKYKKMLIQSSL